MSFHFWTCIFSVSARRPLWLAALARRCIHSSPSSLGIGSDRLLISSFNLRSSVRRLDATMSDTHRQQRVRQTDKRIQRDDSRQRHQPVPTGAVAHQWAHHAIVDMYVCMCMFATCACRAWTASQSPRASTRDRRCCRTTSRAAAAAAWATRTPAVPRALRQAIRRPWARTRTRRRRWLARRCGRRAHRSSGATTRPSRYAPTKRSRAAWPMSSRRCTDEVSGTGGVTVAGAMSAPISGAEARLTD